MSDNESDQVMRFSRLACGGIYEMAKTIRNLSAADELEDIDVHLAIACGCLRVAASEIAAMPDAEISPFLEFLQKQFVVLQRVERGSVIGAHSERVQ